MLVRRGPAREPLIAGLLWPALLSMVVGCASAPAPELRSPAADASWGADRCQREPRLDPLVTEWPASEKAHLQSLLAHQPVAVRYDGCELLIVDDCKLPGVYGWMPAPSAPNSLHIESKSELEEKLPIGGFRLEGELERSGALELETVASGRFELNGQPPSAPDLGPCTLATHLVMAITVGSFRLLATGRERARGQLELGVEVGAESTRERDLLRQAGLAETCSGPGDGGPAIQCASPLQLSLAPLSVEQPKTALERARKTGAVLVQLRAEEGGQGRWTLHDPAGSLVCPLPCERWLIPNSGHRVQHVDPFGVARESILLASGFPVAPGERALGVVHPEQGAPNSARIVFWGVGAPALVLGGLLALSGGISWLNSGEDSGGLGMLGAGLGLVGLGGGLYAWRQYSHEARLELRTISDSGKHAGSALDVAFGPGYLRGRF